MALNSWIEADKSNKQYVEDFERIYTSAKLSGDGPQININEEWNTFKARLAKSSSRNKTNTPWLRVAASIVILAALGYLIWTNPFQSDETTVYARNESRTIQLPDSSLVTLNVNSSLTYSKEFDPVRRQVSLQGEAYFKIKRDESRPFLITLAQTEVEVLGTSFNVDAASDNEVIVIVNSGKVRFREKISNEAIILEKGDKGVFTEESAIMTKSKNSDINFNAWKTRKLVFEETDLASVIKTINKAYNSKISIALGTAGDCELTVTFDNQSLDAVLSVLEATLGLEYQKNGDIIEVIKADC